MSARTFTEERQAQGFTSQAHLDAWFASYDHVKDCPSCGLPAGTWLSDGWQPAETRCAAWHELDRAAQDIATRARHCTQAQAGYAYCQATPDDPWGPGPYPNDGHNGSCA